MAATRCTVCVIRAIGVLALVMLGCAPAALGGAQADRFTGANRERGTAT